MVVNTHMRSMKRAKRRITADLHDLLTFPTTADGISADLHGPFRENVKAFIDRHARASPAHALVAGSAVRTWRVAFKVGEAVESGETPATVELVIAEEDVARSKSVYCDQCRIVGWSGHPVCKERYHFIIQNKDDNEPSSYVCARCGNTSISCNLRCNMCGHEMLIDDLDKSSPKLDDPSHLLHGMVHSNGYGHLLRVNGREGGSKLLTGYHIMSFWDRLCKLLHVRKITVMDVSKKFGLEYRLLHAIVSGHPWYGKWGYEFHAGSFGLTATAYHKAIDTLSGTPLSLFFSHSRRPWPQLQNTIMFYWTHSGHQLVTLRDLFALGRISKVDIMQVETTLIKILQAAGRSRWVPAHALRGAACRRAKSPEIIDNCLQTMEGKILSDGSTITARYNPGARTMEYSLEAARSKPSLDKNLKQTTEHILHDLKFLYDSLLNPSTMEAYKPTTRREAALSAAATLLDCKQLIKHYDEASHWLFSNPLAFTIWCHVEPDGNIAPPQEPVTLPLSATIADLKQEATKAFQETYLIFRHFQAEQLLDYHWMDDKFNVKNLIGANGTVRIKGKCLDEHRLAEFNMERGIEDWVIDCSCGAKDDDGERMVACDACGVWQHTRCAGIHDFEQVPAKFVCMKCIHKQCRPVDHARKRHRTSLHGAFVCKNDATSTIPQAHLWVDV